jgi:hypothetical protein
LEKQRVVPPLTRVALLVLALVLELVLHCLTPSGIGVYASKHPWAWQHVAIKLRADRARCDVGRRNCGHTHPFQQPLTALHR